MARSYVFIVHVVVAVFLTYLLIYDARNDD
jgi:hypothetical protein